MSALAFLRRHLGIVVLVLAFLYAAWRYDGFLTRYYLVGSLLGDSVPLAFAALGMTLVIITGAIDLSVGAVAALAGVALAALLDRSPLGLVAASAVIVSGGALFGASQAAVVRTLALPSFIVTLAGLFLARGFALLLEPEARRVITDENAIALGSWRLWDASGFALAAVVVAAALAVLLQRTRVGRTMFAIGADADAARTMGLPTSAAHYLAFSASGACAAAAGLAFALAQRAGDAKALEGYELDAIAAAVIGGAGIGGTWSGGRGSVCGTLFGVATLALIQAVITFDGTLSSWWARIATGGLLLLFVAGRRE